MTVDQLLQLEDQRMETMSSSAFQDWVKSLNVSRLHVNEEPLIKARLLTRQYNYERKNKVARMIKSIYL